MQKNPDRDAMIFKLWNEGVTSNNIAKELGVTRNSVMGTIHRAQKRGEDLMKHFSDVGKPKINTKRIAKGEITVVKDDRGRSKPETVKQTTVRSFERLFEDVARPVENGVKLLDLRLTSCRFIVEGVGVEAVYCGKHAPKGVYCADHYKICYVPRAPAKKKGRIHALAR